jgi:Recombination directionality factor-like
MAVLDVQRRGQQIGRLRIGQQVAVIKDGRDTGKTRPARLETFRFTTGSRASAEAIAALYGGEIRDWQGEFEVITAKAEIGVTVPPRDEVISQWYEMWSKGGCQRRCNSQHEQISNGPCLCPHAKNPANADEVAEAALKRAELSKTNPPQACKLVTRISVMIPDLPGLGVFRLDTGSYYAATEIGDSAELMQMARDKGVFLPAILRIEHRSRVAGGQTKKYPVPVLEVLTTFRDLATGAIERGGMAAQLPPAPGEPRLALTAGGTPAPAPAPAPQAASEPEQELSAQQIAGIALMAETREHIEQLVRRANQSRVGQDLVCTDEETDTWEELLPWLRGQWQKLPAGEAGGAA